MRRLLSAFAAFSADVTCTLAAILASCCVCVGLLVFADVLAVECECRRAMSTALCS